MSAQGLVDALLLMEVALTVVSVLVFLWAGVSLLVRLGSKRRPRVQNLGPRDERGTPATHLRGALASLRGNRIRHFRNVSEHVIADASDLLASSLSLGRVPNYEARTMLPLVIEARRFGEKLLSERRRHHALFGKSLEAQIEPTLLQLLEVEGRLREIPRAAITLKDVTAGRFE